MIRVVWNALAAALSVGVILLSLAVALCALLAPVWWLNSRFDELAPLARPLLLIGAVSWMVFVGGVVRGAWLAVEAWVWPDVPSAPPVLPRPVRPNAPSHPVKRTRVEVGEA